MYKARDSEDGTVEKEEVVAGESDAHTSNEGSERNGAARHGDGTEQQQSWENASLHRCFKNCCSVHVLSVDSSHTDRVMIFDYSLVICRL